MGFDQYHEPPDELPGRDAHVRPPVRVADRGGRGDRLVRAAAGGRARPPRRAAIMRDAQGEEFKHFCMDLEFLLRRTPLWREIAAGHPVPGRRHRRARRGAEEAAVEGAADRGEPAGRARTSLGIGSLRGAASMSHLLREHAPITDGRLGADRRGGARAADARAGGAQARRLRRAARLGALGDEPRAHRARSTEPPAEGVDAAQRRVLPLVELRAPFSRRARRAAPTPTAAPRTSTSTRSTRRRTRIAVAENIAVFHGWKGGGHHRASPRRRRTSAIALGEDCERYPRHVAKAVEPLLSAGIDGPYGLALGPGRLHARARDQPSTAATRCSTTCARSSAARSSGRPASRARSSSACAAATSCSSRARTSRSATTAHDADAVQLYLEESFSFRVVTPEAAVPLSP